MKFSLSDDVLAIQEGLRAALRSSCPAELLHVAASREGDQRVRELSKLLGDMGVLGLLVPEAQGGLGFDELFLVVALEELGYVAAPGPLGETIALAAPLLAETPGQEALLDEVLKGTALVAYDEGEGHVAYAQVSDAFILMRDGELGLALRGEVAVTPLATVDLSRRAGEVEVNVAPVALSQDGLSRARERATLAAAAELVGLSSRMLDMTKSYVLTREQFGVPIGSFQAVKHALANALIAIEFARPAVWRAAVSMSSGDVDASWHVSMAKSLATDAARQVAKTSIQCHGAMGYTVEYDLHHFAKRAWARCEDWGDSDFHVSRIADWLEI